PSGLDGDRLVVRFVGQDLGDSGGERSLLVTVADVTREILQGDRAPLRACHCEVENMPEFAEVPRPVVRLQRRRPNGRHLRPYVGSHAFKHGRHYIVEVAVPLLQLGETEVDAPEPVERSHRVLVTETYVSALQRFGRSRRAGSSERHEPSSGTANSHAGAAA